VKSDTIKQQKTAIVHYRGFESHPVRSLSDSKLQSGRNKNVTNEINDFGFRKLVGAVCLRAFLDRFCYGKRVLKANSDTPPETLQELEQFIQLDAPKWWAVVGFKSLSGDWLLRHCRGQSHLLSMRWHQLKGGLV